MNRYFRGEIGEKYLIVGENCSRKKITKLSQQLFVAF
jgi:hypothetical protein